MQAYMSPELTRMQKYGPKTEVWSLGATLYEMCLWLPLVVDHVGLKSGLHKGPKETDRQYTGADACCLSLRRKRGGQFLKGLAG